MAREKGVSRFGGGIASVLALVLCACFLFGDFRAHSDDTVFYKPEGGEAWDFWFAHSNSTYHAFYLEACEGLGPEKYGKSVVGSATSSDLVTWKEVGEVLRANPKGEWCDSHIATGSVWNAGEKWRMLFTACGTGGGIGLAESADLRIWKMVGPAEVRYVVHVVPDASYWQRQGLKAGESIRYEILADPYVLPDSVDGWYYMVANCAVVGRPVDKRGCVGLLRSKEGRIWEDCGIIALMLDYDRPETPQIWQHGERWYLYFGGARERESPCRHNLVYSAASLNGPFEPLPRSELVLPDGRTFYIAKVVTDPTGRDVLLACLDGAMLSRPYPVEYAPDGSITLRQP